ncbi:uncharacterized protein LOC112538453 isoform X2 [Tetranychus urticae]|uniref:uncharacterized protein LOC112538453 isoform X2 n=1 Tax=Tetranychus urticae TaxID=32264 RepID=UPI000D651898|nr:uncharacterized protein LOC112538453 isoform X2 [Tetranychus urticae]
MDYVINFYDAADLMTRERLFKPCFEYFHKNFTIKYLPVVLTQVKKSSKLINSGAINSFICRHFLKIANTNVFLDYPVETVEHIFKLDLMIYSEYQVFESIMKWVNKNEDSRKEVLPKLLTFVRWSFMDPGELSKVKDNELIKTLRDFDSIISSNGDCESNRTKQNYFASIQELDDPPKLRINIFDKDLFCLPIGDFTEDKTMSTEFVHGEHMSDILFKTGRDVYRVDWAKKTFTWFDTHIAYYPVINNAIVNFQDNLNIPAIWMLKLLHLVMKFPVTHIYCLNIMMDLSTSEKLKEKGNILVFSQRLIRDGSMAMEGVAIMNSMRLFWTKMFMYSLPAQIFSHLIWKPVHTIRLNYLKVRKICAYMN